MRGKTVVGMLVVAVALAAVGCDSTNKGKIEGTKWSSNEGTIHGQKLSSGKITLEFYKDGTLDFAGTDPYGNRKVFAGKYTFGMGSMVVMTFDQELAGMKTHAESISVSNGELTMTDSDGTRLVFSRLR
jgi:hypothetical protein